MLVNYPQRFCLAAYRKKTTLLVAAGLSVLILFGLEYSRLEENKISELMKEERDAQVVADALMKSINVKFIETAKRLNKDEMFTSKMVTELDGKDLSKLEQPSRDEIAKRKAEMDSQFDILETEQQLGIPYVNLDPKNPYVPKKRIVHLDLKGAPPILSFFKKFFALIKVMGATGVLLEYEDMFPFSGILKNISAKNAFTPNDIKEILQLAEESNLEVIPLIQTFGHVEFALKHAEFAQLREVPGSPQALCPSRAASLNFIKEMIAQVMVLHPKTKYLHIGCDEVFQMGECDVCRLEIHENLFLKHVKTVSDIVHTKHPHVRVIIWDDMLRHIPQQSMQEINLGKLIEPMVWVYAEDIYHFVQPAIWEKYSAVFPTAWTASAFKGAFGETIYVPNAKRHLENNLRWLDVMATQTVAFKRGLSGITLTGWQRYDHFAVLCELLPAAIPSLALNLIAVSNGYFNSSLKEKFLSSLSCPSQNSPFISLDIDPFLWDKLNRCMFPGNAFFRLTNRLQNMETEAREYLDTTKRQRGWMTEYNVRHNYSLPLRVEELTTDLPRVYHGMINLARSAAEALAEIFDNYTVAEWIEQRIYPYVVELERVQNQSIALKSVNQWPARPLPPLKDLQRLGVAFN